MRRTLEKPLLYFAAPLFSTAERRFNEHLAHQLEIHFDIYLPQRDGGLLTDLVDHGVDIPSAYRSIFQRDIEAIRACDALLIVLDGRSVDEGAAFELGMGAALGKLCVAFQSDTRRLLPYGNNPMLHCALEATFSQEETLLEWARSFVPVSASKSSCSTSGE